MTTQLTTAPAPHQTGGLASWYRERRGRSALEISLLFLVLQAVCSFWYFTDQRGFAYLSKQNLGVMTQSIPWLALLTVGSGVVMMVGEIDLSVAMNFGMCVIFFLTWYQGGNSAIVCIVVTVLLGIAIGLFNAILINVTKIPSLIASLGMMGVLWGLQIWYAGGDNMVAPRVKAFDPTFEKVVSKNLGLGIRAQMLWLIMLAAVVWIIIHRHRLGNHIAAVGGNESAAKAISIKPWKVRMWAFGILGALAGLAAVLLSVQTKTMLPGNTAGYELDAIAAAVVGGTALRGGKGSVIGMVLGCIILKTFQAIVLLSDVFPAFYLKVFTGGMLVVFAAVNQYFEDKAV